MGFSYWNDAERVAKLSFRQRGDGDWDFFPGIFGRGYLVNAKQRQRIFIALRHYESLRAIAVMLAVALATLGGATEGSLVRAIEILAVFFVALCGYRFIRLRPLWRDLPRTEPRDPPVWRDAWRRKVPVWQIIWQLLASPLLVTFGSFLLWRGIKDANADVLIVGIVCLLSGVAATWHGIDQVRMRREAKRQGG